METFWGHHGWGSCYWHLSVEARDAIKHPMVHRSIRHTKTYTTPNISSAEVKNSGVYQRLSGPLTSGGHWPMGSSSRNQKREEWEVKLFIPFAPLQGAALGWLRPSPIGPCSTQGRLFFFWDQATAAYAHLFDLRVATALLILAPVYHMSSWGSSVPCPTFVNNLFQINPLQIILIQERSSWKAGWKKLS